jgi:hypothetical protein
MERRYADNVINRNFYGTQENNHGEVFINGVASNCESRREYFFGNKSELVKSGSFDLSYKLLNLHVNTSPAASKVMDTSHNVSI